jgi:amino acid transporter
MVILELLVAATIMIALSKYIFKGNRFLGISASTIIITIIFIINYYGIELSSTVINSIAIGTVLLLIFIILYGYTFSDILKTNKTSNKFSKKKTGIYGFLVSCTFIIFLFTGFDSVAKIHDEIKEDEVEKIPGCITLSILIVAVIYMLLTFLIIRLFNDKDIQDDFLTIPLLYKFLVGNMGYLMAYFIGIIIVLGSIVSILLTTSRYMHGLSKENILPEIMSELNKYKTPTYILLISYIVCIIFIFIDNEKLAMNLSNIFTFLILICTNMALVIYRFYDYNKKKVENSDNVDTNNPKINNKEIHKQYKMPGYINNIATLPFIKT